MNALAPSRLGKLVYFVAPFVVLVLIWIFVKEGLGASDTVLPSPADVGSSADELVSYGILPFDISKSLGRLALSAVLAAAIGVPIGLLLGSSRYIAMMFGPFLRFFQSVSGIAILPLVIMWFGFTEKTIQIVILYTALVPVIFNTMTGVSTIPPVYRDAVETLGGSRWTLLRAVYLPGALASIVVGVRLGIGYGWRALIAAEMLVGLGGLGFMIFDARRDHLLGQIFTGMILIGVLYLIVDRLILSTIEDMTVRRWGVQRA